MRRWLSVLAFAVSAVPATATPATAPVYLLSMHVAGEDWVRADPVLQVRAGEPATIAIGDASRRLAFTLHMTAAPAEGATLAVRSDVDIQGLDGVRRRATPSLVVALNERATIEFGELGPPGKPLHIEFKYQRVVA